MRKWIASYGATALAFLGCDSVWLTLSASRLYRPRLGPLLRADFAVAPAVAFYLVYIAGILVLAVAPSARWRGATGRGAMLGFTAYATYDLTNQATLRGWPTAVTIADLCWGTALTALAATVGFLVARGAGSTR